MRLVPVFRLPWEIIQRDVDRILDLGVKLELNHPITGAPEKLLHEGLDDGVYDAVYVATGFQRDTPLRIPGVEGPGVLAALDLLDRTRRGERPDLGRKALVIGGGDTAMDAVRTSRRLTGNPTTIVYRRTRAEMPASPEELEGALEEGNILKELVSPVRVVRDAAGKVTALECVRNELGEPGADGRRQPVAIPGSEFSHPVRHRDRGRGPKPRLRVPRRQRRDAVRRGRHRHRPCQRQHRRARRLRGRRRGRGRPGEHHRGLRRWPPCGRSRSAGSSGIPFSQPPAEKPKLSAEEILEVKRVRARKAAAGEARMLPIELRKDFDLIDLSFTEEQARGGSGPLRAVHHLLRQVRRGLSQPREPDLPDATRDVMLPGWRSDPHPSPPPLRQEGTVNGSRHRALRGRRRSGRSSTSTTSATRAATAPSSASMTASPGWTSRGCS